MPHFPLPFSRHLSTTTASSPSSAAIWHLLRSHSPPPPLETALSTSLPSPPTPSLISSILSSSSSDPALALRFFVWASLHHPLPPSSFSSAARSLLLPSRPHLLHLLLDSYLSDRSPVSLKTFTALLTLSRHASLPFPLALSLFRRMPQFHVHPNTPSFNLLLRLPSTPPHSASHLLQELKQSGLKPDNITYLTVIKKLAGAGELARARELLGAMRADGCAPNVVVYSALLDGACVAGDLEVAVGILAEMEREGCGPNVVSYTCLVKCLCEGGRLEEAVGVLERMGRSGVGPNRVLVKTLIKGFCDGGRVEDAYKLIEGLVKEEEEEGRRGLSVEECYSLVVVSLVEGGDLEGAERILRRMLEWGVRPDGLACNCLMREVCKKGRFLEGYRWIGALEEKGWGCVDSDVYSCVLRGLCEEGHWTEAVELGRRVVESDVGIEDCDRVVQAMEKIGEDDLAEQMRRMKDGRDSLKVC